MPQEIGRFLSELRASSNRSLRDLELRSGISRGTLSRWESGHYQPRLPELQSVLAALDARPHQVDVALALIQAPRATRQVAVKTAFPKGLDEAARPMSGDLLRAMRRRAGLTLQNAAERLGVEHTTISRWEQSRTFPSPDHQERLFDLLYAEPEERQAVAEGRLLQSLPGDPSDLSNERFITRLGRLQSRAWAGHALLLDLDFMALEVECWRLAQTDPSGRERLAETYVWHAQWLAWRNRHAEARERAHLALDLMSGHPPRNWWTWAPRLAVQRGFPFPDERTVRQDVAFLQRWMAVAEHLNRNRFLFSRIAEYALASRQVGIVADLFKAGYGPSLDEANFYGHRGFRWTHGKTLVMQGRPYEAMEVLPPGEQPNVHQQIDEHLTWCEALIAVGETSRARDRYRQAQALMDEFDLRFPEGDRLALRL